jgi:hypothetical protein
MPFREQLKCTFQIGDDGEGQPSRIYIEISDNDTLLDFKRIARQYLAFKKGTTRAEARTIEDQLNRSVSHFYVVHLAPGEV